MEEIKTTKKAESLFLRFSLSFLHPVEFLADSNNSKNELLLHWLEHYDDLSQLILIYSQFKKEDSNEVNGKEDFKDQFKMAQHILSKDGLLYERLYSQFTNIYKKSFFFYAPKTNPRIIAQQGNFIFCQSRDDDFNSIIDKKYNCELFNDTIAVIPDSAKKEILEELDLVGINECTIFPDLDHTMKWLKCTARKITD